MLTAYAFGMVVVFMALILSKRVSALVALVVVPIATAILAGFGRDLGPMMLQGITSLAPTGVMLMFAILYFGIMIDAGLFDPLVRLILRLVGGDPLRIAVGTAALALFVSLDGDGSTTYMIVTAAMLPLYRRTGMNPLVLTCTTKLASGIGNLTPWGGPTARAATALRIDPSTIFLPLLPSFFVGALWVLFVAWVLGRRERRRLGVTVIDRGSELPDALTDAGHEPPHADIRRPKLLPVNLALTLALLVALGVGILPIPALFIVAFAIGITLNYPTVAQQKERLAAHAGNALSVVALIFAAGIFTGILSGTKMVDAMGETVVRAIPTGATPYLPVVTALVSIPFTFFVSNDAFYFGVLPVLAGAGAHVGIAPAEMGRAGIVGQPVHLLSPLVPSTYLLVGLAKVELGDHQRFTLKWALGSCLVLLVVALLVGVVPWVGGAP